jgi:hypothetical protein
MARPAKRIERARGKTKATLKSKLNRPYNETRCIPTASAQFRLGLLSQAQVREILQNKCAECGLEQVAMRYGVTNRHLDEVLQGCAYPTATCAAPSAYSGSSRDDAVVRREAPVTHGAKVTGAGISLLRGC